MTTTRTLRAAALVGAAALLLAGCASGNPLEEPTDGSGSSEMMSDTIVVGSQAYYSNEIIAEIYAQALENAGFDVERQFNIGQRDAYIPALESGEVTLFPEYSGNLLQYFDPGTEVTTPDGVLLELFRKLPGDLSILNPSPAEDKDTVAVTSETAQRWNLTTIGDLAEHSAEVKFGGPSEFINRAEGLPGLKANYGLDIPRSNFVAISDGGGPATVRALTDGTVTAANIFSTSPAIEENDLVVLEDPKNNFLAANVIPLVSSQKKSDELKTVLDAVSAELTTEDLIRLNTEASGNSGVNPDEAAANWVREHGFDQPVQP